MIGPSDKAMEAAWKASPDPHDVDMQAILEAAYPIIRADVIAEAAAFLRDRRSHPWSGSDDDWMSGIQDAADFIEREFGGKA